jgi:error-prone DNA polymerase
MRQIGFGILFGRPVDEVTSVDHQGDRRDRSSPNKVRDMFVPDLHIGTLEVKAPN